MSDRSLYNDPPKGMPKELIDRIAWKTLKEFRQSHELTQKDISIIGKISQAAVSQIELGQIVPSRTVSDRWARYFGYGSTEPFHEMLIERTEWSKHHFLEAAPGDWKMFSSLSALELWREKEENYHQKSRPDYEETGPGKRKTIIEGGPLRRKSLMSQYARDNKSKGLFALAAQRRAQNSSVKSYQIPKYNQYATIKGRANIDGVIISANPDTMQAPSILHNIENAYALEMINNEMQPRYFGGDTLFVDPSQVAMPSDDVVIQLHFVDRSVAIVSRLNNVVVEEEGISADYEFVTYSERQTGIFEIGSSLLTGDNTKKDPEIEKLLDEYCRENAGTIGIFDDGSIKSVRLKGHEISEPVQSADVHVIVGSFHRRYGAFARHMTGWDGNIRGSKR